MSQAERGCHVSAGKFVLNGSNYEPSFENVLIMEIPATRRRRAWLYVRLSLAAGLLGIAVGFYVHAVNDLDTSAFDFFSFAVRGIIIGAAFWYFEIFWVQGPRGRRLRGMSYGARLITKVIVYVLLVEAGYALGYAIFNPEEALAWVLAVGGG
ncbi:MAG: hypothetical protein CMM10_01490 [Rhodospirillaceae bacterium]|nr:hypothetical protein [Rhodospirillaceae bacterium]